jgi:hypothetical protein
MKTLLIGAALVAMLATPALAQSFDPDLGTGNVNPPLASLYGGQRYDSQGLVAQGTASRGTGPYAQVPDSSASSSTGFQSYINREDSAFPIYKMKRGY